LFIHPDTEERRVYPGNFTADICWYSRFGSLKKPFLAQKSLISEMVKIRGAGRQTAELTILRGD
jgi:hypothetical protein